MDQRLTDILEALLFSSSEPLPVKAVQTLFLRAAEEEPEEPAAQGSFTPVMEQVAPAMLAAGRIREALTALAASLDERGSVYQLVEGPAGWRLVLRPGFARWVRLLRDEPSPRKLGASMMETLAVVAYRQPVTRAEVEAIRGVACERTLAKLVDLELLRVAGRAELPGRPLQYATTERFLEYCGMESLEELPSSDLLNEELLGRVLEEESKADKGA